MKPGKSFVTYGALAILLLAAFAWILRSPPATKPALASCSLVGYTRQSGTNLVLLQITNRTKLVVACFVEPRMYAQRSNEFELKDRYPAAAPVFLAPHGNFVFSIPCSTDTNLLYVGFDVQETEFGMPRLERAFLMLLRKAGLATFKPATCHLASPPFGRGEPKTSP